MSKKVQKIEVVKVPTERPASRPKRFPSMNRMYLELMENKDKIHQDLVNKEYNPVDGSRVQLEPEPQREEYVEEIPSKPSTKPEEDIQTVDDSEEEYLENAREREKERIKVREKERIRERDRAKSSAPASKEELKSYESDEEDDRRSYRSQRSEKSKHSDNYDNNSDSDDDDYRDKTSRSSSVSSRSSVSSKSSDSYDSDDDHRSSRSSPDDEELSNRIRQLLKDEDNSRESSRSNKKEKDRHRDPLPPQQTAATEPPSLSQLESAGVYQGKKVLPDLGYANGKEEEEEDKKRELLFKFEILKKSYRDASVPDFNIHSDYSTMAKSYESTLRHVSLDNTVDTYKKYLIAGFMIIEYAFGRFLNFDMQGFTQQQVINMGSYERLLIEMGEKSYVPGESKWPVELRLLGIIMMNAAMFLITKMISIKSGASNLFNVLNSMGNSATVSSTSSQPSMKPRRMRGPSMNLDDLPESESV